MVIRDGYVATQHYTANGWHVKVGDTLYTWTPSHNISLGWVKEGDLSKILNIDTRACCVKRKKRFFVASAVNVKLYETGER